MTEQPGPGTFCWNELMTPDVKAAETFYGTLLGWTMTSNDAVGGRTYHTFRKGEQHAGGMMAIEGPQMQGVPPCWLAYIRVESVAETTTRAESLGAKVEVPPTDLPGIGSFSVITDPTGATVGLFQSPG